MRNRRPFDVPDFLFLLNYLAKTDAYYDRLLRIIHHRIEDELDVIDEYIEKLQEDLKAGIKLV